MSCPGEGTVIEYVENRLAAPGRARIEAHLDRCPDCLALVGHLARSLGKRAGRNATASTAPMTDAETFPQVVSIAPDTMPEPSTRYALVATIAETPFATLSLSHDAILGRRVALHVLRANAPAEAHAKLAAAAHRLAGVSHPNIARVLDSGTMSVGSYVVTEIGDAAPLLEWARLRTRSPTEIVDVLLAAGRGLSAAHRFGVDHGGFAAATVFVGEGGAVLVTGFGADERDDQVAFASLLGSIVRAP